jgi:hypothetical protein
VEELYRQKWDPQDNLGNPSVFTLRPDTMDVATPVGVGTTMDIA